MTSDTTLTLDKLNDLIHQAAALYNAARPHGLLVSNGIHEIPRALFDQCASAKHSEEGTSYTSHGPVWFKTHPSRVSLYCNEPPPGHVDKTWCIAKNALGVHIAIRAHDVHDGWTVVKKDLTRDELDYELSILRACNEDQDEGVEVSAQA